jgi:hypothetical protein
MEEAMMEQAMIKEQTKAEVLGATTTFTLHILDFVKENIFSGKILDKQNNELLQKDCLISSLIHESKLCFLTL